MFFFALLLHVSLVLVDASTCPFTDKIVCLKWDTEMKMMKLQYNIDSLAKEIGTLKGSIRQKDDVIGEMKTKNFEMEKRMLESDFEIEKRLQAKFEKDMKTKIMEIESKMQARVEKVNRDMQSKIREIENKVLTKDNEVETKLITKINKTEQVFKANVTKIESKMQAKVEQVEKEMKNKDIEIEQKMQHKDNEITNLLKRTSDKLELHMSHKWQMKRVQIALPKMTKISLKNQSPVVYQSLSSSFPKRTRAIIISLYSNIYTIDGGSYLIGTIGQTGNHNSVTHFHQQHFWHYDDRWIQEFVVPWNEGGLNQLELTITKSDNSGPNSPNYYTFKVAGYIVA